MSKLIKKLFLFVSCLIITSILFSCMQGTDVDNTTPEEEHPVIKTPETEQIYYSLILDSYDNENADSIIEILMEITKLESEDAKDLIEILPVILKTNIPENEIDIIIKNLEISGAKARKKISDKIIENFTYTVTLESFAADKKIPVIKIVREITGLGLGESKALVEGAPKTIRTEVSKADADNIISKIEAAGGKASKKIDGRIISDSDAEEDCDSNSEDGEYNYTVTLESFDAAQKIPVIKAVMETTGLGLGESKALVEGAPNILKTDVSKADADDIINRIEAAGGKASKTYK